jgi:hypothetical protein
MIIAKINATRKAERVSGLLLLPSREKVSQSDG